MKYAFLIVFISAITIISSCRKEGLGGKVEVVAFPQHHGESVRTYKAFVKFNSKELPGTTEVDYDLVIDADTTENHIELGKLKAGNYFIYMIGYDTAFMENVSGGIPYTISNKASGELEIIIPVKE